MPVLACLVLLVAEVAATAYLFGGADFPLHEVVGAIAGLGAVLTIMATFIIHELRVQTDDGRARHGEKRRSL